MPDRYIIRTKDEGLTAFYRTSDYMIKYKLYENGGWSAEQSLIDGVREGFTVNIADNGNIYLFCRNGGGDVILCMRADGEWKIKTILQNAANIPHDMQFGALVADNVFCAIYNVAGNLVTRKLDKSGEWRQPIHIDEYVSVNGAAFSLHNTSAAHTVLSYFTADNSAAYREINQSGHGGLNIVYQATGQVMDSSFTATNDAVHFLFAVKGLFSSQLIYRKKDANGFGNIIALWEGQRFENCMIFKARNILYVTYMINGQLFYITSSDNGGTFTRPMRYRDKLPDVIRKAVYVSDDYAQADFFCHEIYVDKNNAIIFVPTLYENFYAAPTKKPIEIYPKASIDAPDGSTEKNAPLKNRYKIAKTRLEEKDRQIMSLTNTLKIRNDEMVNANVEWKKKYKRLLEENEDLKYRVAVLEKQPNLSNQRGDSMNNSVLNTIAARSSVRAYGKQKLSDELIEVLTDAALAAPSSMNKQPWHISVVTNDELISEIEKACFEAFEQKNMHEIIERLNSRGGTVFYNAPAVIFIAVKDDATLDAGIMVENIALAAKCIGLDSVIIGLSSVIFGDGAWEKRLQFPDGYAYAVSIAVGYAEGEFKPHEIDRSKVVILE